jgi:hypothetical protein
MLKIYNERTSMVDGCLPDSKTARLGSGAGLSGTHSTSLAIRYFLWRTLSSNSEMWWFAGEQPPAASRAFAAKAQVTTAEAAA